MSKCSSHKAKMRGKQKNTKATKVGDGNISQQKSRDVSNLQKYMKELLQDEKSTKEKKGKHLQIQRADDISTYLKDVINECTCKLNAKSSVKLLLEVVRSREMFAEAFNDSLVDEAKSLLPSVVYRQLATSLVQEAQQAFHEAAFEVGEALLSYLYDIDSDSQMMTNEEWKALLGECTKKELVSIFKHLLAIGVQRYRPTSMDVSFHRGLEIVLASEASVDGLALLLQDEVQQAKDQAASFFSSTELGCLLSLNTVSDRDKPGKFLLLEDYVKRLIKSTPNSVVYIPDMALRVRSSVTKTIQVVATALGNMLKSNSESNRQSALAWMAAVISADSHNHPIEDRSDDAYFVTFSVVLLHVFSAKLFPENLPKSVNFSHHCCSDCSLSLEGETSLTGETMTVVGRQRRSTLSNAEVLEELIFCCHRTVSICLLPRWYLCLKKKSLHTECSEADSYVQLRKRLHEETLWDDDLHRLVAQLYVEQCNLLLHRLDQPESQETTEELKNELSQIPYFFVTDVTLWIDFLFKAKNLFDSTLLCVPGWSSIVTFCIRLLECSSLFKETNPTAVLVLIVKLQLFVCLTDQGMTIMERLSSGIQWVLPTFLSIYKETENISGGLVNRFSIIFFLDLLASQNTSQFQQDLRALSQDRLVKEFLASFLRTLQRLVHGLPKEMVTMKPFTFEWIKQHCCLLCKLVDNNHIHQMFSEPDLSSNVIELMICMVDFLCIQAEISSNCPSSRWQKEMKQIIGRGIQSLLVVIKMGPSTLTACSRLSLGVSRLAVLECDSLFHDKSFPDLMDFIKKLKIHLLQNQEPLKVRDNIWMAECLGTPVDEDALFEAYQSQLQQAILSHADLQPLHGYRKLFLDSVLKSKTRAILEAEMQRWKRTFPSSPSAAVFLVLDKERMDVMRCVMSGPTGTPYSLGLFVFDIFCPADYPSVPPRVRLVSTVDGAVFFGSYMEDNEVSLASLQKKPGTRTSQHWSMTKVSHLLKNMMLTAMKETTQDDAKCTDGRSRRLCQVRAHTVHYAMLEPLKVPPVGLEEVVGVYFIVQQQALLKQCARWVQESPDDEKLKLIAADLFNELQALCGTDLKDKSVPVARLLCFESGS